MSLLRVLGRTDILPPTIAGPAPGPEYAVGPVAWDMTHSGEDIAKSNDGWVYATSAAPASYWESPNKEWSSECGAKGDNIAHTDHYANGGVSFLDIGDERLTFEIEFKLNNRINGEKPGIQRDVAGYQFFDNLELAMYTGVGAQSIIYRFMLFRNSVAVVMKLGGAGGWWDSTTFSRCSAEPTPGERNSYFDITPDGVTYHILRLTFDSTSSSTSRIDAWLDETWLGYIPRESWKAGGNAGRIFLYNYCQNTDSTQFEATVRNLRITRGLWKPS